MSGPVILSAERLELGRFVSPGDGIVWGQACAEPVVLVDALVSQAPAIGPLRAFAGPSWRDFVGDEAPASLELVSYGAIGSLRRVRNLKVVPARMSDLPRLFASRLLPCDVALVQVAPPDEHGRCSLGVGVDYIADALEHATVVIAEVNDHCPRSTGGWIDWDRLDAAIPTSRPLLEAPDAVPDDVEQRIAAQVAAVVQDGETIQIGVGGLPEAITHQLCGHRRLGVHSGMVTDGVLELIEAGVVTGESKPHDHRLTVAGAAIGSVRLFDALARHEEIVLRPVSYTHSPRILGKVGRLCAINSALEVDFTGQVNCESLGARALGAAGGQADFLRAATLSGGAAIVALPASRIVEQLSGPVSVARSDVDWVITEHGARSLRGLTLERRRNALSEIAGEREEVLVP
jgi:acyl-CoA hydrolase